MFASILKLLWIFIFIVRNMDEVVAFKGCANGLARDGGCRSEAKSIRI